MHEEELRKTAAVQEAALGQYNVAERKRNYHIREVANGWIVQNFYGGGLIGYQDEASGTFIAPTLEEAVQHILKAA